MVAQLKFIGTKNWEGGEASAHERGRLQLFFYKKKVLNFRVGATLGVPARVAGRPLPLEAAASPRWRAWTRRAGWCRWCKIMAFVSSRGAPPTTMPRLLQQKLQSRFTPIDDSPAPNPSPSCRPGGAVLLHRVVAPEQVAYVREGILRGRASHTEHSQVRQRPRCASVPFCRPWPSAAEVLKPLSPHPMFTRRPRRRARRWSRCQRPPSGCSMKSSGVSSRS